MKATHNKASEGKVKWKFPCLGVGRDGDIVILFTSPQTGTALIHPQKKMGYHSFSWMMSQFTPLPSTESVTLQND
jgi:hypothetical protein